MNVSIITTFYNGTQYLSVLLDSVRNNARLCEQQGISLELILINDSPDCELCIDTTGYDFEIRIHTNERNMGIHASRIKGVSMAQGEYIIFLDQDDILEPEAICSHYGLMKDKVDVVVGNGYYVDDRTGKKFPIYCSEKYHKLCRDINTVIKYGTIIISPGQCMIRKSAIPKAWLSYAMQINGADDEILWLAMLAEACKFQVNPRKIYQHLENGRNTSNNIGQLARSSMEGIKILKKCKGLSVRQLETFKRRRRMKKERYLQPTLKKVLINLKYADLSLYIIWIKLVKNWCIITKSKDRWCTPRLCDINHEGKYKCKGKDNFYN